MSLWTLNFFASGLPPTMIVTDDRGSLEVSMSALFQFLMAGFFWDMLERTYVREGGLSGLCVLKSRG